MSKYLDSLRSARPEHMYVFNLSRTDLNGGTVSDDGYNPLSATVVESANADIDVRPGLIEGVQYASHPQVIHDFGGNTGSFAAFELDSTIGPRYFGSSMLNDWSIEVVFRPNRYNRGRNNTGAALVGIQQTGIEGLLLNFDFSDLTTPTVQFEYQVDLAGTADYTVVQSTVYNITDDVFHVVLGKSRDTYSFIVNGNSDGSGIVSDDYVALSSNTVKVGGWDSTSHADVELQSIAFFDRTLSPEEAKTRYNRLTFLTNYELTVQSFEPDVTLLFTDEDFGNIAPLLESLADNTNSDDVYVDENGYISIQPSELGVGVTKYKKIKLDLSGLTSGVSTYLVSTAVSSGSSSVDVEYSFDDVSYSPFAEGLDTVTEFDANWGGVV